MSNIFISDIDIVDVKLTDILQLSEQAQLYFQSISQNYNIDLFNIYLDILNDKYEVNLLKSPLIDKLNNNDYSNKYITPIINYEKYTFGNAVPFNINNNIINYNWGENKIGENLKLKLSDNGEYYTDNKYKFLDFFKLLEDNTIFTTPIYNNTTLNTINIKNDNVYVIRDCREKNCIKMVGSTYIKGKNIIDDYNYKNIDFDDRVVIKDNNIDIVGYKLQDGYIINNLVYIPKLEDHGFINNIIEDKNDSNKTIYEVYTLDENKIHKFNKKQIDILDYNKYYYFDTAEEHNKLIKKLVPSLENILYSINFQNNIYSLDKIIEIINLFDYNLNDISICNINLISNLINNKIEEYTSNLYTNKFKYNYYLNYYTNINEISIINNLITFYLNNISTLIPTTKNIINKIIEDNKNNIINLFDDIIFNTQLLCKNYLNNTFICYNRLLEAEVIIKYDLDNYLKEFNEENKTIFMNNINKIFELILFNNYYNFIKQYYNMNNIYINLYNNPLYNLSYWIHTNSIDHGITYYQKAYKNYNIEIDNKNNKQKLINNLNTELNKTNISDDSDENINIIVKKYLNMDDMESDNNKNNILRDIKYTPKKDIINITLNDINDILINGYNGTDKDLKEFYNKVDKGHLINHILTYNNSNNSLFYNIVLNKNDSRDRTIKISKNFVKDDEIATLDNKYYIRKNNIWELFDEYNYDYLYNTNIEKFDYKKQLDYLTNKTIIQQPKFYNTLYDKTNIYNINHTDNNKLIDEELEAQLNLYNNINDVKSNIVFNTTNINNLEDVINNLNYNDNGYGTIKDLYKLKDDKYGDYKSLDKSKSKIDEYPPKERNLITNGFHYYFKYEFVKFISNVSESIKGGGVNRAFYKCYDLLLPYKELLNKDKLYGAFIAEAPGSFIYCIQYLRNDIKWKDFRIITLIDDENTMYQHNFYKVFKNQLVYNKNNNGDVTKRNNLLEFKEKMLKITNNHLADITTADGGFAMSDEWYVNNIQENLSTQLVFGEIIAALMTQAKGGVFILKIFDTFTDLMVKMIYLLQLIYDKVEIVKPVNSRIANSEKYIVSSGFKYEPNDKIRLQLEDILLNIIEKWDTNIGENNTYKLFELFPDIKFDKKYIENIKYINNFFAKRAIFIQEKTYESIKDKEFRILINNYHTLTRKGYVDNIQYFESRINDAKKYCIQNNLPFICKYNNISKCPHNNDIKNATNDYDIKNIIKMYRTNDNDPLILNEIFELVDNIDDINNINNLLYEFKNNDTKLHPKIKYYLGNFICKYCNEPIICKHYNLLPNNEEIINHFGIDSGDSINCYICGDHLSNIDDRVESFTKSGELIKRITTEDIDFLNNEGKIFDKEIDRKLHIEQFFKIYKYKQNVIDENISLMTLIFNHLNKRYLTDEYKSDDIYIIYNLLYNDFLKDFYNDINKSIIDNIITFDDYKNIFRDLFLITKNDNNNTKNIKNILQKKLQIPPISNKVELINYINNFYNDVYSYYINHYFIIIIFSLVVFKTLIQDTYYNDLFVKKLDKDMDIINEINFKILDSNTEYNLFTHNNIIFKNINNIVNNGLNSSQYNKLFNIYSYFNTKDKLNSKSIFTNIYNLIEEYISPKLTNYIKTQRINITEKPKLTTLYKPLTEYSKKNVNITTLNLTNSLEIIYDNNNNNNNNDIVVSYIDKIRALLIYHYEEDYLGLNRIFNNKNIDINTLINKNKIIDNISLMNLSTINNHYNNIIKNIQLNNLIQINKNIDINDTIDYYKYIENNLNISFNFKISSDLDIINHFKNRIPKQKFVNYNPSNMNVLKYNSILNSIQLVISFISNYNLDTSFYNKYIKYKFKYHLLYNNILNYLLQDYYLFDNYNEELTDNNILLKYLCIYIKDNITNNYNFINNGSNYILTYIYQYILNDIISNINNISADKLSKYLKEKNIKNITKLTNNLINYKNKIYSIIQLIIDKVDNYNFTDTIDNIINIQDTDDITFNGIDENNIQIINSLTTNISSNLDATDNEIEYEHFDFLNENDDEYDQEYDYE